MATEHKENRMRQLADKIWSGTATPEEIGEYNELKIASDVIEAQSKITKSREMRNRRKRGRYGEKKLAKEIGGRRDGGIGRKDVVAGMFSYEVKTIKRIPSSIIKIMEQAERLKKRDTMAVGVFRCNSPRREYFILERQDWLNLHGNK